MYGPMWIACIGFMKRFVASENCPGRSVAFSDSHTTSSQQQQERLAPRHKGTSQHALLVNSLQWGNAQITRADPTYTVVEKPLSISGLHHLCWAREELPRRGLQLSSYGEAVAERKEKKKWKVMGAPLMAQEEAEVVDILLASDGNKQVNDGEALASVGLLKACAKQRDLHTGMRLHADIVRKGLIDTNGFIDSILVNMYAKCGVLDKAQDSFYRLPIRDTVSWTALIAGYAQHGRGEEALKCFELMQHEGISPDTLTFSCILKACCSILSANKGQEIHAQIVRDCLLEENVVLANALVDMYAKCGALDRAQEVFDELPIRDVVSWNTLITGYVLDGQGQEALMWFEKMQAVGFSPSVATFLCVLKACGSVGAADKGQETHSQLVKVGLLGGNITVANALVDMYAKCGLLADAKQVCDKLPARDVVTWNTLIGGYTQHGYGEEALHCFDRLQHEGFSPNEVTFTSTLKACGMAGAVEKGQELFAQILKQHLLQKNVMVANAVVDMFLKCGQLKKAREVFDKLLVKDVVSWNALMVGYGQQGQDEESLSCFEQMQLEGFSPDTITFTCILKACGSIGAAIKGQEVHGKIVGDGLVEESMVVGTALVDMYAKCGMLVEAQEVFDKLPVRDVALWNALMAGYSQLGEDKLLFFLIDKLIEEGKEPNSVTFTIVLNTCSHSGLFDKGQAYFEEVSKVHDYASSREHFTCMIDLFGRAGHMNMAIAMIGKMFFPADLTLWLTLLGACQRWGKMKLGRWAFGHAAQLKEKDAATYSYMGNIFAATGKHEVYHQVEALTF